MQRMETNKNTNVYLLLFLAGPTVRIQPQKLFLALLIVDSLG